MADYDALVLGAGVSGLVSTAILLQQDATRVLVIDEYPAVGGNHIDRTIGDYTFDVGSLIFQDDSPLLRWFPELMRSYLPVDPSWSRLNPQGVVTRYPFSIRDDLVGAGAPEVLRILGSAALARLRRGPMRNAKDYAQHWLGPRLADRSGLLRYMERFCGIPADRIDLQFAESRMSWIEQNSKLRTHLRRLIGKLGRPTLEQSWPKNRELVRPAAGFAALYDPVVSRLAATGAEFLLGRRPDSLRRGDRDFVLRLGGEAFTAKRVISTIPVDHALELAGLRSARLPTVTLITLFYSFAGVRGFDEPILYNFSHAGAWKRLTMHSDFYGERAGRSYFAVEVIDDLTGAPGDAAIEFRAHTEANGLFRGDLRLEGHHLLTHAYPVYTAGSGDRAKEAIGALRAFGVESFGRQGGFQYQPTARVATREAEAAFGIAPVEVAPQLGADSDVAAAQRDDDA